MRRGFGIRWPRARAESPWFIVPGVVLAVCAVLIDRWHGLSWVLALGGVLVAAGGVLLDWGRRVAARSDTNWTTLERSSRSLSPKGKLRTVAETPPEDFGFHRGDADPPYLRRDRHQDLVDRLAEGKPVLLVGHSLAGKTRLAYEVVRERYGRWRVWIPERPDGLATLLSDARLKRMVVWLDDLEDYLNAGQQLRLPWLEALERKGCRVVATIRASAYEKFQPTGEVRPPQGEVLERFAHVWLVDNEVEQNRLAASVPDAATAAGIRSYGIGEYLGGGYLALRRFDIGRTEHPFGVAMLHAAADWRRLGLDQVSKPLLFELAPHYLPGRFRNAPDQEADADLVWAAEDLGGRIRLLEPVVGGWRIFDFLFDYLSGEESPIPEALWQTALAAAAGDAELILDLGHRAYGEKQFEWAAHAWQQVIESDSAAAPEAALNLGLLRDELHNVEAAADAYQRAIDSGHSDEAPKAAVNLGLLWDDQGNPDAAVQAYQLAFDSHHPDWAPRAAVGLGMIRKSQGALDTAQTRQLAIDSGHPGKVSIAALELGKLYEDQMEDADVDQAVQLAADTARAYQLAIDFAGPNEALIAAEALMRLRSLQDR